MTGQFLQVDPAISVTREPCAYVAGDPLASVDPLGLCKGMDGTPQDRVCSGWDFFMESLPGVVSNSVKPTFAGLAAGSTFGIGLLTNNDQACYGNDLWFKISYGLGVASSAVGILAVGGGLLASGGTSSAKLSAGGGLRAIEASTRIEPWAGSSLSRLSTEGETMYRVFGGGAERAGSWLTPIKPLSSAAAREGLALPAENAAKFVSQVSLPAGVRMQAGAAAPAFGQPGGWAQVQLLERIPLSRFGWGDLLP